MTVMRFKRPSHTQIPNEIFDELMAVLSGAEFKVLCYIARRTFGFGKEEDAISQTQLATGILKRNGQRLDAGTGLSRSTVQTAIKGLLSRGLIAIDQRVTAPIPKGAATQFDTARYRILVEADDNDGPEQPDDSFNGHRGSPKTGLPGGPPENRPMEGSPEIGLGVARESGEGSPTIGHTKERHTKESSKNSSSSSSSFSTTGRRKKITAAAPNGAADIVQSSGGPTAQEAKSEVSAQIAGYIEAWAKERRVRRQRDDGQLSTPDTHFCCEWAYYCAEHGILDQNGVYGVLDAAKHAADACADWRRWKFLDVQVQLASERYASLRPGINSITRAPVPPEDETTEWARLKREHLRPQISEAGYANWLESTRQVARGGGRLTVAVPDPETRLWLTTEYAGIIRSALDVCQIAAVEFVEYVSGDSEEKAKHV